MTSEASSERAAVLPMRHLAPHRRSQHELEVVAAAHDGDGNA
jgi:hypothetical protein